MAYGVLPTGFARKPLPAIIAEIEEAAKGVFGEGVIQTPESPLGQLNGLMASIVSTAWEIGESTYQSYDPGQAEGVRLDQLARIRFLERVAGEQDAEFRLALTNQGRVRIDLADIARAAASVEGVSWVQVFHNSGDVTDTDGVQAHSVAVAVIGGSDAAVAAAIRAYIVPGIDAFGNVRVDVNIDGYCRSIGIIRPVPVPIDLQVAVERKKDQLGCPPPSNAAIALTLANALTGTRRPANGRDISLHLIRSIVESAFANVEVTGAMANLTPLPFAIGLFEIAAIDPLTITVVSS